MKTKSNKWRLPRAEELQAIARDIQDNGRQSKFFYNVNKKKYRTNNYIVNMQTMAYEAILDNDKPRNVIFVKGEGIENLEIAAFGYKMDTRSSVKELKEHNTYPTDEEAHLQELDKIKGSVPVSVLADLIEEYTDKHETQDSNQKDIVEQFYEFLDERGLVKRYLLLVEMSDALRPRLWLSLTFTWIDTAEGEDMWNSVNKEWKNIIESDPEKDNAVDIKELYIRLSKMCLEHDAPQIKG